MSACLKIQKNQVLLPANKQDSYSRICEMESEIGRKLD